MLHTAGAGLLVASRKLIEAISFEQVALKSPRSFKEVSMHVKARSCQQMPEENTTEGVQAMRGPRFLRCGRRA